MVFRIIIQQDVIRHDHISEKNEAEKVRFADLVSWIFRLLCEETVAMRHHDVYIK